MKYNLIIAFLFFLFSLSAQQKGATPLETQNSKLSERSPLDKTGQTYAVVVGISDYQDEGIPDLRFADKDALAFAGFLQSPAGGSLDEDHLKVLVNEQATVAQFAMQLDWLWEVVKENDRVIIYFSGHGDVEKKSITQPGYLLCWDAPSKVYLAGGAMNVRDLNDVVSTLSIQNKAKVVLITDACRAGKLSGSGIGGAQATASNLAKQYANEIKILSCQPDEYSIEGEQWGGGRGAFSYHLLDGLYGMADRNTDQSVNLMEIRSYLEENVSTEVAPQNQLPMVVGNGREKLTDVFPEILEQLKEGKKGQLQLFTPMVSRGIEDEVLAVADSNIVEMYLAFQKALADKQFLFAEEGRAENDYADYYYEKLIKEPQLERLHSSMRRNYAAALQDDAQQVLNTMLKSGLTENVLRGSSYTDLFQNYPAYLEKASELLGKEHYMYNTLQARKYFFEGMQKPWRKGRRLFRKALEWQSDMPHAMVQMIYKYGKEYPDSAMMYFEMAKNQVPQWIGPYLAMSNYYQKRLKQPDKAENMLELAGQVDSTSVLVWYKKAEHYHSNQKYDLAEKWYLKAIEGIEEGICFPCLHIQLGMLYTDRLHELKKGEEHFKQAIYLDSLNPGSSSICLPCATANLGVNYQKAGRFREMEEQYKKAIQLDSNFYLSYLRLGNYYIETNRYAEAKKHLEKVLEIKPRYVEAYNSLGRLYYRTGQYNAAEKAYKKATQIDSNYLFAHYNLGNVYISTQRIAEAKKSFYQAVRIDSSHWLSHAELADVLQLQEQWEASIETVEKALKVAPDQGDLISILGNAYTHLPGGMETAKEKLDQALELSPELPDIQFHHAQWYLKDKQLEKAWEFIEKGLAYNLAKDRVYKTYLEFCPDFAQIRKDLRWNKLMQKYFPT